jgi:hypothetical protein
MRQNAGPIRALAGFKGMLDATKYQELLPDPFDQMDQVVDYFYECKIP